MSAWVLPHARNGSHCPICHIPVYWGGTGTGWQDSNGKGSHRQPGPRGGGNG